MGAWGAGNFENDDAMDLVGELDAKSCAKTLEDVFEAAAAAGIRGELIDAADASRVMAAAELVAAARGHAAADFPEGAVPFLEALKKVAPKLVQQACSAVSYVLMRSELVDLWAESDDPSEWNKVATGLIARLDAPARAKRIPKKKQDAMTSTVCSFCGELISTQEFVSMDLRRPWTPAGLSQGIFAHESCLNAKLHPRHIIQWWTPPGEPGL